MSLDKIKIESKAKELVDHFDPKADLSVEMAEDSCNINIETEISGLLIGRHGETLEAFQHLMRIIVTKDQEEFIPISLDIAGYRAARIKELQELTNALVEKIKLYGGSQVMPPMNSSERRQIHLCLQDIDGIEGESEGEEPYRRIVIRSKK